MRSHVLNPFFIFPFSIFHFSFSGSRYASSTLPYGISTQLPSCFITTIFNLFLHHDFSPHLPSAYLQTSQQHPNKSSPAHGPLDCHQGQTIQGTSFQVFKLVLVRTHSSIRVFWSKLSVWYLSPQTSIHYNSL